MLLLVALVLLALIGLPLYSLFGIAALILALDMPEGGWEAMAVDVLGARFAENPALVAIPLVTFAAHLLARARTPQRLLELSRHPFEWRRAWRALRVAKWELAIPLVLIGSVVGGLLRIHEASAFTAVYVLVIEVLVYRDISLRRDLPATIVQSMTLVGVILVTALCLNAWMIQIEAANQLLAWLESIVGSQVVLLLLVTAVLASVRFSESCTHLDRTALPFIGVLLAALVLVANVPLLTTGLPSAVEYGLMNPNP